MPGFPWMRVAASAIALAAAGCPGSGGGARKPPDPPHERTVTIIGLAALRGQIEPCGCTTNPLGDLARTAEVVADARTHGPVVALDAGSLLYTQTKIAPSRESQEQLKADLIVHTYATALQVDAIGLGANDLARGAAQVKPPRQAANLPPSAGIATEPAKVIDAGGVRVGVFGLTSVAGATDPVAAAKQAIADLRGDHADLVVALLSMSKKDAKHVLESAPGIDLALADLGADAPEPDKTPARAESIDGAWLIVPANRGQIVSRIDVTLRGGTGALVDAIGPAAAAARGAELDGRIAAAEKELAGFASDPHADPAFVATKQQALDDMKSERARLAAQPLQAPAEGSYFTLDQIHVDRALACDTGVQAAKVAYEQAAGAANVAAARSETPAPPAAGKATYVGAEACNDCHGDEYAFWQNTKHTHAWKSLEDVGKQFDYDCIGCHVTGWEEPGGATMGHNDDLRSIQCEVCHGPGSLHVAEKTDAEARATIQRVPPADLCATRCHTKEHSDTFQLEAYLRDIVGKGHGEERRKQLGDGPTGHELRSAGLAKAAQTIGAGCTR